MRTLALILALALATPAAAQVEVTQLAAPDYFSLGSPDTGLSADLWRGTSPDLAWAVIPQIGRKPLSPAATALAARLLATGATGPEGVGNDPEIAAGRVQALLAMGKPREAWAAVSRASNLSSNAALSQAAAESALIAGEDDAACAISEALSVGRGELYWLRLRAYCQARAGQAAAAQLTLTLASEKERDPVVSRLIGAVIAGAGDPGAASLRNGLEYSLSKRLALDLPAAAKGAAPAVAAMLSPSAPSTTTDALARKFATASGRPAEFDALFSQLEAADAKARPRYEAAVLVAVALGAEPTAKHRALMSGFTVPAGAASPGRLAALDLAAAAGLKGETALQVIALSADTQGKPLRAADVVRVVSALLRAGLTEDAVAFAAEAFGALQVQ